MPMPALPEEKMLVEQVMHDNPETLTPDHKLKDALRLYEDLGFQYVEYSDKWFQLSDVRMELEL